MKAVRLSFLQMLRQMKCDPMLLIIAFVPLFMGVLFRFFVPFIESVLTTYFTVDAILLPYYGLLDSILIMLVPSMLNYVVAMVMLEEADNQLILYLAVTPLAKKGYVIARLGVAAGVSLPVSILVIGVFHLSSISGWLMLGIAMVGAVQGVVVALLIVALSGNKVEGLAVGKVASLFAMGVFIPYFVRGKAQYIVCALPSFWVGKAILQNNVWFILLAILVAFVWVVVLYRRFRKKLY